MPTPQITLIGLGPGDPMLLTRAAWEALHQADRIATPTPQHPALEEFSAKVQVLPSASDPALVQASHVLLEQAQQRGTIYAAWRGVQPESRALAVLWQATLEHGITLNLVPDIGHELEPLPVPPESETSTRAWGQTRQPQQPYSPPIVPADPLHEPRSLEALQWVITRLLGPGGCPWDVQQTHQSLRGNLLEEVYEVLEALDTGDMDALAEELGDLLMQVLVHSEMARQAGHFAIGDVLALTSHKLIRRHPHVFGNLAVQGNDEVLHNWEQIKAQELAEKGHTRSSALDGIPAALPALAACQKMGNRAARSGFDWPEAAGAWAKLREELDELQHAYEHDTHASSAASRAHLTEEMGDALYALAQVARWLHIDAESALREANGKFRRRFQAVEEALQQQGRRLADLTLEEKLALWQTAKQQT